MKVAVSVIAQRAKDEEKPVAYTALDSTNEGKVNYLQPGASYLQFSFPEAIKLNASKFWSRVKQIQVETAVKA